MSPKALYTKSSPRIVLPVVDVVRTRRTIPGSVADLSDVRNGSRATNSRCSRDVRFSPNGDQIAASH